MEDVICCETGSQEWTSFQAGGERIVHDGPLLQPLLIAGAPPILVPESQDSVVFTGMWGPPGGDPPPDLEEDGLCFSAARNDGGCFHWG